GQESEKGNSRRGPDELRSRRPAEDSNGEDRETGRDRPGRHVRVEGQAREQPGHRRPRGRPEPTRANRRRAGAANERRQEGARPGPAREHERPSGKGEDRHRDEAAARPGDLAAQPVRGRKRERPAHRRQREKPDVSASEDPEQELAELEIEVRDERAVREPFHGERLSPNPRDRPGMPQRALRLEESVGPDPRRDLSRRDPPQRDPARQDRREEEHVTPTRGGVVRGAGPAGLYPRQGFRPAGDPEEDEEGDSRENQAL